MRPVSLCPQAGQVSTESRVSAVSAISIRLLLLAQVPYPLGAAPEQPEAQGQDGEEQRLMQGVPEILEEARVEVYQQEGEPEALGHGVVVTQTMVDGGGGHQPEQQRPIEELVLLHRLPGSHVAVVAEYG